MAGSALLVGTILVLRDREWQDGFERSYALAAPFRSDPARLVSGQAIFRERCQPCHGERGRGNGPLADTLDPKPADLVLHAPQHTDGELFYFISKGVPRSAMPAWEGVLSETERWELVHWVKALASSP